MNKIIDFVKEPRHRVRFALLLFFASLILWPITALTIFKDEPQGVLGLSWFAITLTAFDIICTTDVRNEQEKDSED